MNKLELEWLELEKKNFIYTKHNNLDIYRFAEIKKELLDKAEEEYYLEEGFKSSEEFDLIYIKSSQEDKKLIDNEINIILKKYPRYIKLVSELRSINKYKSKGFELLTKEILSNSFVKLNGENTFIKILNEIQDKFLKNKDKYISIKNSFEYYDFEIYKNQFQVFNIKKYDLSLAFKIKDQLIFPKERFIKGEMVEKAFFLEDKKKYLFKIDSIPVLRLRRNKNIFFYESSGKINFKICPSFDDIAKDLNTQPTLPNLKHIKEYYILSTPKKFMLDYYIKSEFLKSLDKINSSHNDFKIKPFLKEYNYNKRPDLWTYENDKLIFFEMKFNEFTEFTPSNIINTINYVREFNIICKNNGINLSVDEINIVHINNIIYPEIKELINKYKNKNYNINLIHLKDLISKEDIELPYKINILKDKKNKTIRSIDKCLGKIDNIIIDLTEVS